MFARTLFTVLLLVLSASQWPFLADKVEALMASRPKAEQQVATAATSQASQGTVLKEINGHFGGRFKINGKPVDAMIDTGASLVAINVSTARRLGYSPASLAFSYGIDTANGSIKAAHVKLARIEIGNVRVQDVDAFVIKDESLSSTLIGMSFLQHLKSYSVDQNGMRLVQ